MPGWFCGHGSPPGQSAITSRVIGFGVCECGTLNFHTVLPATIAPTSRPVKLHKIVCFRRVGPGVAIAAGVVALAAAAALSSASTLVDGTAIDAPAPSRARSTRSEERRV